jgi:hypothetical protein
VPIHESPGQASGHLEFLMSEEDAAMRLHVSSWSTGHAVSS